MQSNNFRLLDIFAKKKKKRGKIQKIENIFQRIANVSITSCYPILCNLSFHSSIKFLLLNILSKIISWQIYNLYISGKSF